VNAGRIHVAQRSERRSALGSAWDCIADAVAQGDEALRARAAQADHDLHAEQAAKRLASHHARKGRPRLETSVARIDHERQQRRDYYARNAEAVKAKAKARYAADLEQSRAKARESWHRRQARKKEAQV
jgi:hypothetical protein